MWVEFIPTISRGKDAKVNAKVDAKVDAKRNAKVEEELGVNVEIEGTTKMDAKEVNAKEVDKKK